jgi:hypothetical protein
MGGLINPSSPPSPPSLPLPSKPAPTPIIPNTETADRQRRLDALARERTGRSSTIVTSPRGLLVPADWSPQRKSLLGEWPRF